MFLEKTEVHRETPARLCTDCSHNWRRRYLDHMHNLVGLSLFPNTMNIWPSVLRVTDAELLLLVQAHSEPLSERSILYCPEDRHGSFLHMPVVYSIYTSLYVHKHVHANVQISVSIYLSICIYTGIINLCTSIYVYKTIVYTPSFRMKAWEKKEGIGMTGHFSTYLSLWFRYLSNSSMLNKSKKKLTLLYTKCHHTYPHDSKVTLSLSLLC